ncbi:MAG: hypothetical protein KBH93_04915 [Anaerolineae bacterium]|nr:hypothetical protein [Anaerolineae bacterium]
MKRGYRLGVFLAAVGAAACLWPPPTLAGIAAQTPDQILSAITFPADGAQLFGLVNVLGSAAHPMGFARYTLEYDDLSDPDVLWLPVQPPVQQQVRDGVLGTWDTNLVPDGFYRLRLRVFLDDERTGEYIVSNLRVANSLPTPVPTLPLVNVAPLSPVPSPGPSPTSPVFQPPGNAPASGEAAGLAQPPAPTSLGDSSLPEEEKATTRLNTERIADAFCAGFYLVAVGFALMLGYVLLRRRLRASPHAADRQPPDRWRDGA